MCWGGQEVYGKESYPLLHVVVSLKLLQKEGRAGRGRGKGGEEPLEVCASVTGHFSWPVKSPR